MECLTHQGRRMSGRSAMMSSPGLMSRTATTPHPFPGRLSSRYITRSSDPHSDHVMLGVDILSRLCERGACTLTLRCFGFLLCAMPLCCAVSGHGVDMNDDENFFLFHIPFRILFIFHVLFVYLSCFALMVVI